MKLTGSRTFDDYIDDFVEGKFEVHSKDIYEIEDFLSAVAWRYQDVEWLTGHRPADYNIVFVELESAVVKYLNGIWIRCGEIKEKRLSYGDERTGHMGIMSINELMSLADGHISQSVEISMDALNNFLSI